MQTDASAMIIVWRPTVYPGVGAGQSRGPSRNGVSLSLCFCRSTYRGISLEVQMSVCLYVRVPFSFPLASLFFSVFKYYLLPSVVSLLVKEDRKSKFWMVQAKWT